MSGVLTSGLVSESATANASAEELAYALARPWESGSLFPLSFLPNGVRQFSLILPQTHALALMRYGMMENIDPGLHDIWHLDSNLEMAALSAGVLVLVAVATVTLAVRIFKSKTMA